MHSIFVSEHKLEKLRLQPCARHSQAGSTFTFTNGAKQQLTLKCLQTSEAVSLFNEGSIQIPDLKRSFSPDRHTAVYSTCSHLHVDLRRCTLSSQTNYHLCHSNH